MGQHALQYSSSQCCTESNHVTQTKHAVIQPLWTCMCNLRWNLRSAVLLIRPPAISKPHQDVNKPDLFTMRNWHSCLDIWFRGN